MPDSNNSPPLVDLAALRFALIQTILLCAAAAVCPQAWHLSAVQPAADRGLQEPGVQGGEAAPGTLRL